LFLELIHVLPIHIRDPGFRGLLLQGYIIIVERRTSR